MKQFLTIIICIVVFSVGNAQEKQNKSEEPKQETKEERRKRYIEEANPFRKNGYRPRIVTLSNGKYREAFPDTIVRVGGFTYNKLSKQITGVWTIEELPPSEATLRPDLVSRWFSPDPLSEEFTSWSPYNFGLNNPVYFIDPDGRFARPFGDFIDENGKKIGSDGIDDGKVYVVKTTQTDFDSGVSSDGITKKEAKATAKFIKQNDGNTEAFQQNSIAYDNSVEIEVSTTTRQAMVDIVNQDNGRGGTSDANNREYGGVVNMDGTVSQSPVGEVASPKKHSHASINHSINSQTKSTFHSHPSGQIVEGTGANRNSATGGSTTLGGSTTTYSFQQAPSSVDVNGSTRTNYVFGRSSGRVYIYSGNGVIATIPQKRFVKPKQ